MYKITNKFRPTRNSTASAVRLDIINTAEKLEKGESFFIPAKHASPGAIRMYLNSISGKDCQYSVHKQMKKDTLTGCYVYRKI